MASTIKVDEIRGSTGSTVTIPTGQTLTMTDGLAHASLPTVQVAKGGTNLTSFTAGDVLYATGSTTLAKLPKGTAEQVLAMNSGATAPDWGSVDLTVLPTITVAKGGTNIASFTAGDILYATGATTLAKLAKGTGSQTLRMNSGATAPEWVTAAAGGNASNEFHSQAYQFFTSTSSSMTDVTGLTATITPSATSKKILLLADFSIIESTYHGLFGLTVLRDIGGAGYTTMSNAYIPIETGATKTGTSGNCRGGHDSNDNFCWQFMSIDSPNTTSAVTYKWQVAATGGSTLRFNSASGGASTWHGGTRFYAIEL